MEPETPDDHPAAGSTGPAADGTEPPGGLARLVQAVQRVRGLGRSHQQLALWISLALFAVATVLALRSLPPIPGGVRWIPLVVVAVVLVPLGTLANAGEYAVTVAATGERVRLLPAVRVALMASAANLLPIPGAVLVRVQSMRNQGVSYRRAAGATVITGLGFVGVAVVSVGVLQLTMGAIDVAGGALVAGGLGCLCASAYALRSDPRPVRLFGGLVLVELGSMSVKTLRLVAVLAALRADAGLREASALALAVVISLVVGVFPGGLGIREVLTGLLAPTVGLDPSLGVAVSALDRVVGLVARAGLSGLLVAFSGAPPATEEPAEEPGTT